MEDMNFRREERTGEMRKLPQRGASPYVVMEMKSRRIKWAGHVPPIGNMINA